MAIIVNVARLMIYGEAQRLCVYLLKNVTTNDTIDLKSDFYKVVGAQTVGASGNVGTSAAAGVAGTVVTVTAASYATDDVFLIVFGAGAP